MSKEIELSINMAHLQRATSFINENNTSIEDAVSQEEVLEFILGEWGDRETLGVLTYKGIFLYPQIIEDAGHITVLTHITTLVEFSADITDFVSYRLGEVSSEESIPEEVKESPKIH